MFSIQYFEQNLWWGWDCIQVLISKVEMDIGSSLRSGKWCHCSDLWKSSCALPTGGPHSASSSSPIYHPNVHLFDKRHDCSCWSELKLVTPILIGPIGRRDDLWPAEVVNCVSLFSELKLNWRCWDWSVTPIAHLRPQTVVGENSRSRGEGVSDHLLIWSYNHTFKVISKPYTGSLAYLILKGALSEKKLLLCELEGISLKESVWLQQDHTVCRFFIPQKLLLCQSCFYSASFPFCSFFLTDPLLMLQTTCNLVSLDCTGLQGATLPDLLNYTMYNFSSLYSESGYSRTLGTLF